MSLTGGGAQGIVGNALYLYLLEKLQLLPYFDEIWGVSAGSIVGGGYASGMSVANIIRFAVKVKNRDLLELSVVEKIKKRTGSEKKANRLIIRKQISWDYCVILKPTGYSERVKFIIF